MSRQDFCHCTPSEFQKIFTKWQEHAERADRVSWEQTRTLCLYMISPYTKKTLKPEDIMQFPWEKKTEQTEVITEEERKRRYEVAKKNYRC